MSVVHAGSALGGGSRRGVLGALVEDPDGNCVEIQIKSRPGATDRRLARVGGSEQAAAPWSRGGLLSPVSQRVFEDLRPTCGRRDALRRRERRQFAAGCASSDWSSRARPG